MLINGYDEGPVVAGEELLSLPGFWAAHLMWMCASDGEPSPEWFGVDAADIDAADEALTDAEAWPAFRIPFANGHTAVVVNCNLTGDAGTEYFIAHPDWERPGRLATIDGHQAGPGLAWRELIHIARTPALNAAGVHDAHARLLLLLPALGDEDLPDGADDVITEALLQVGVPPAEAPRLARCLLNHPLWEAAAWTWPTPSPLSGSREPFDGILQCDGHMSPRCGSRLAQGITREQNDRLAQALGTWPSG